MLRSAHRRQLHLRNTKYQLHLDVFNYILLITAVTTLMRVSLPQWYRSLEALIPAMILNIATIDQTSIRNSMISDQGMYSGYLRTTVLRGPFFLFFFLLLLLWPLKCFVAHAVHCKKSVDFTVKYLLPLFFTGVYL